MSAIQHVKLKYACKRYQENVKIALMQTLLLPEELTANVYAFHFENNIIDTHNELIKMAEHHAKQLHPFQNMEDLFEDFERKNNFIGGY